MATLQRLALRGTPKATKLAARYTPAGGAERCGMCRHFAPSSSCARIEGPVSAAGWCALFSRQVTYPHHAGVQSFGGAPSLDNSFTTPGSLPAAFTLTRTSVATYFDVNGAMQTAATGVPRWDYDPITHALNGLLIEDNGQNILLNNATLSTQNVTTTAQTYTLSFYGTGSITLSGTATGTLVGAGAFPRRAQLTFTPTAGTLTCTVTGSVLNAQLEALAFASSWIPTAGAVTNRARDVVATGAPGAWFNATTGSLALDYMLMGVPPTTSGGPIQFIGANGNTDYILPDQVISGGTATAPILNAGLVSVASVLQGSAVFPVMTIPTGIVHKGAISYGLNAAVSAAHNGVAAAASPAAASLPTIVNLTIGGPVRNQARWFLWARRVRYWPRTLSTSELQTVTTT